MSLAVKTFFSAPLSVLEHFDRHGLLSNKESRRVIRDTLVSHSWNAGSWLVRLSDSS